TEVEGQGSAGPVRILLTAVPRSELPRVRALLEEHDPRIFYSVEALASASAGIRPAPRAGWMRGVLPEALRLPSLPLPFLTPRRDRGRATMKVALGEHPRES